MNKLILAILIGFATVSLQAQADATVAPGKPTMVEQLAATIKADDIKTHLEVLTSDAFEGRETGTEGQKKAAAYLASVMEQYGLPKIGDDNSYFQKISFISENWNKIAFSVNDENLRHLNDYYSMPALNQDLEVNGDQEVLFLGYGIDDQKYSDYQGVDVRDKIILIYDGEPFGKDSIAYATGARGPSRWSKDLREKLVVAYTKGVKAVLVIDPKFRDNVAQARKIILNTSLQTGKMESGHYANHIYITSDVARKIVGNKFKEVVKARKRIQKKGKSKAIDLPCRIDLNLQKKVKTLEGENVLGYIEGIDPALKDQLVVISAHYDHLGKRGDAIYYGADDNASGTSSVLDICQAFVEARRQGTGPRRSVLILLVSGEEKGLLGSQYYTENPIFPLENTVADLNVDMVGRLDTKHADNPNYVYVIGADRLSTELHQINEAANTLYTHLDLDYTYNDEKDPNRYYYRSDHYHFAEHGIPAAFFFSGTHADYHRPTDTADKILFDKAAHIAQLVFYTAWELANRDKRIEVDVTKK